MLEERDAKRKKSTIIKSEEKKDLTKEDESDFVDFAKE